MWSATWPKEVQALAHDYLGEFYQVTVGSTDLTANKDVTQKIEVCADSEKYHLLSSYLREHYSPKDRVLVFVETKKGADMLTRSLRMDGYKVNAMHGDKSQEERDWALKEFKNLQSTLLVATDVAARGLDIDDIRIVVQFDMAKETETFVHRVGRTGRAGKKGFAVSFFVPEKNGRMANELIQILQRSQQEIPEKLQALASFGGGGGGRGGFRGGRGGGGRRY